MVTPEGIDRSFTWDAQEIPWVQEAKGKYCGDLAQGCSRALRTCRQLTSGAGRRQRPGQRGAEDFWTPRFPEHDPNTSGNIE